MHENNPNVPILKRRWPWLAGGALLVTAGVALILPPNFESASQAAPAPPTAADLRLNAPTEAVEGRPVSFGLGWNGIRPQMPMTLTLRWEDTSYRGEHVQRQQVVSLGEQARQAELVFQSAGRHRVQLLGPDQAIWKTLDVAVKPYPATIFPAHYAQNTTLGQSPEHYHIWVNLFYDAHQPQQRQYLQITEDDRILERLLISSGAMAGSTPMGEYRLGFKEYYPRSHKYNDAAMPFWSAIDVPGHPGEVGFHALEDGGYAWYLGKPASHGCIRMSKLPSVETDAKTGKKFWGDRGGARWIYDRVPQKTAVSIFKTALPAFAFEDYQRYLARTQREAARSAAKRRGH